MTSNRTVLLTGATGFVGHHLFPSLIDAGFDVRCASRNPERAHKRWPDRRWLRLDVDDPSTIPPALEGCDAAVFLIHGMASGPGYAAREALAAEAFARAAVDAGVQRVVYLGGVEPEGTASPHLQSRLETGSILRREHPGVIELRAGMVIGAESESWRICRDLAARLPFMILPRWMASRSQPIALSDVIAALTHALSAPLDASQAFDIPGPEIISARDILTRIAALRGVRPFMFSVPVITPRLSSYWLRLVTRADYEVARELVEGLTKDLIAHGDAYWDRMPDHRLRSFDDAASEALDEGRPRSLRVRTLERFLRAISRSHRAEEQGHPDVT